MASAACSASSSASTQCLTGSVVPLCKWPMQPMLAETIAAGCGSAGTYSVLQPELSHQLRDRKLMNLADLDPAAQLLAVLQRAGRVEGQAPDRTGGCGGAAGWPSPRPLARRAGPGRQHRLERSHDVGQQLAQVAGQLGNPGRLVGVGRIQRQCEP